MMFLQSIIMKQKEAKGLGYEIYFINSPPEKWND